MRYYCREEHMLPKMLLRVTQIISPPIVRSVDILLTSTNYDDYYHYYRCCFSLPPEYGKKIQYAIQDLSLDLDPEAINYIQQVTGKFGYPSRSVDNTMQHALNDLAIAATKGTEQTMEELVHFLNFCATNPDASIIFRRSDMILSIDSNAAYLVAPKARSRAGGYHYLGNKDGKLFNDPSAFFLLHRMHQATWYYQFVKFKRR